MLRTIEVLARNGVEVIVPEAQGCCGRLAWHTGICARQSVRAKNLEAFPADVDAILTNAAGLRFGDAEFISSCAGHGKRARRRSRSA